MYKFLLVDDESIIREGISQAVDWDALEIELKQARDGFEAYALVENEPPDAIITDIKMPGMDGLELIEKVYGEYPDIEFVILSGYGEFDYANKAMRFGVRHYLLKPSNPKEITGVLRKVLEDIREKRQKEAVITKIKQNLMNVLPQVKEQFLRDFVMNRSFNESEKQDTLKLLNLTIGNIRIVLFKFDKALDFQGKFLLKGLAEDILGNDAIFCTILEDYVLIMLKSIGFEDLMHRVIRLRQVFFDYCGVYLTAAVSEEDDFHKAAYLYKEVKKYHEYSFYLPENSIITKSDIVQREDDYDADFDYGQISLAIRSGNTAETRKLIGQFFEKLKAMKLDINVTKTYCLELYMSVARQAEPDKINTYVNRIMDFQQMDHLNQICDFIMTAACNLSEQNYEISVQKHNRIIQTMIEYTHMNINNEELSLSWLARKILYMNVDYLGKLFKKNTGESFSNYLSSIRIAKAKELIRQQSDFKIYEIAEQVGYGKNPQYFSQVFKKLAGCSPSEYKKITG